MLIATSPSPYLRYKNLAWTCWHHCRMKWFIALSFVGLISLVESQYEDVRCKCVCPSVELHKVNNETHMSSRVFVHSFSEPQRCRCQNVVADEVREANPSICDHCECQWQRRNTTTIKVTVILIVCVVSLLFLYMMFLLCLDPLMTRRPYMYQEHRNVEVNMMEDADYGTYGTFELEDPVISGTTDSPSTSRQMSLEDDGATRQRPVALMTRVKQEVQKVHGEQQKWKGKVKEQRRHIYDAHTMLN